MRNTTDLLGNILIMSFGFLSLTFNKTFSQVCRETQKSLFNKDYNLWSFRIPIYLVGSIFLIIGFIRIFY